MYNPGGTNTARDCQLPFEDSTFDIVLMKSVFTHRLPADVPTTWPRWPRVETRRSISDRVLSAETTSHGSSLIAGVTRWGRSSRCPTILCAELRTPEMPEAVIAHDESRIRARYAAAGFNLAEVAYGDWCDRRSLLGLQDLIVAMRE
jgi:hypothetical protein